MSWVVKCLMNNFVCVLSSFVTTCVALYFQKQPPRCVLSKRCSKNMQQIYRGTLLPKWDFNLQSNFIEIALRHGCSSVKVLHIFKTSFSKNTSGSLLLYFNPLSTSVAIVCLVNQFLVAEQINWLVPIWRQH